MNLLRVVPSAIDRTQKYVFQVHGQIVEFSYIDKQDGKDIICVPTQTSCKLGCAFCFLTTQDNPVINLKAEEILTGIRQIIADRCHNETLLISFMGAGEPLNNQFEMFRVMQEMRSKTTRFAVASLFPSVEQGHSFTRHVLENALPVKLHLSLHFPSNEERKRLMPASIDTKTSVSLLQRYQRLTGNPVEVHYTLISAVNDTAEHAQALAGLLGTDIPVKLLTFKAGASADLRLSQQGNDFRKHLESQGVFVETYDPPGGDIGSSCGQFLFDNSLSISAFTSIPSLG